MVQPHDPWVSDRPSLKTGFFRERMGYRVTRPRGTNDWLLIYTLRGGGLFTYRGGERISQPHDVVLIEPGVMHSYEVDASAGRWHLLWAHFIPPALWYPWLKWPTIVAGLHWLTLYDSTARRTVAAQLRRAHDIRAGYSPRRHPLALNALEAAILCCDEQNPQAGRSGLDPRIERAMDQMCRRLTEPMSVADLARVANLSVSRFSHLFRQQVGQTPQQFLEQQRLLRGKELLEHSGLSIKQIAGQVGYQNPFYFTLRFRRNTGFSPRAYRRHIAEQ
jgi:AraC family transcriptional regulator, arabinose operon regulatory protein